MNTFPNNPTKYAAFFEALAAAHANIQATDENGRFLQISQSATPFATWDLSEMDTSTRNKLKLEDGKLLMVLIMMDDDPKDNAVEVSGTLLLLAKTKKNDYQSKNEAYTLAFNTGYEIFAWVQKYFNLNKDLGTWSRDEQRNEAIGPVEPNTMFGWAFNFGYKIQKRPCITEEIWGEYMPFKEPLITPEP